MKKLLLTSCVTVAMFSLATVASADRYVASPYAEDAPLLLSAKDLGNGTIDAFGDPGDFGAAHLAGADYLVGMQADITEDNAGNGTDGVDENPDDPDDAGWDWATAAFSHSTSASPTNIYGATAQGLVGAYLATGNAAYFTAMTDVADHMLAVGPTVIRTASDITFLLDYADLPGVTTPALYQAGAPAIWNDRIINSGGGTATGLAEYIREARGASYQNGIIGWDIGLYAVAAARLDAVFPGMGYDISADDIAEVLWQDSFNANPGYFDHLGACMGHTDDYSNVRYYWYSLGITGLIDAFVAADLHTAEVPGLQTLLLDCQYDDGAFGYQYGAPTTVNDRDWQATAYGILTMGNSLTGLQDEINYATNWLAATQDVSGGFVYGSGNHYPEVVGECVAGMYYGIGYQVDQAPLYDHISVTDGAGYVDRATLTYTLSEGSLAYRSITVFITYDTNYLTAESITQIYSPVEQHTFQTNLPWETGVLEVTLALYGQTDGVSGGADLFSVTFDGIAEQVDPGTLVQISQVVMRDPVNADIFCALGDDAEIEVDDSAPVPSDVDFPADACVIDSFFDVMFDLEDNVNLDYIQYSFDNATWLDLVTGITTDTYTATETIDISALADEADHTVWLRVFDDVGYVSLSNPVSWTFHKDVTAPVMPTDLTAAPRDHAVQLEWSAVTGADDIDVYRVQRTTYPYFGGLPLVGTPVYLTTISSSLTSWLDDFTTDTYGTRGVYDYKLVAKDCGNIDSESNVASATNYFLGDWASPYDANVGSPDLAVFSPVYGTASAVGVTDEIDVAPTSDMGRFGLPGPDGLLNFEDLIIMAMNYRGTGQPTPFDMAWPLLSKDAEESVAQMMEVTMFTDGDTRQINLSGSALGVSLHLVTDAHLINSSTSTGVVMNYRVDDGWMVDVVATSELLSDNSVIQLRFSGDDAVQLVSVDGRDATNMPLDMTVTGGDNTPVAFRLAQNYPNPFNPATTISYDLAAAADVTLSVYNTTGQKVAQLVNENQVAGSYNVVFAAGELASGVYYYRITAGSFTDMKKMILVK